MGRWFFLQVDAVTNCFDMGWAKNMGFFAIMKKAYFFPDIIIVYNSYLKAKS